MPKDLEEAVLRVMEAGNGSSVFVPSAGGLVYKVSYLWGKLRIDKMPGGFTIPIPA